MEFEKTILINLCKDNDYTQKVISHLKVDFFDDLNNKELFKYIKNYIDEYKTLPTKSVILHELSKSNKYNENQYSAIKDQLEEIFQINEKHNLEWLVDETESYCKTVAFQNAVVKCYEISQSKNDKNIALEIMKDALRVEFNSDCGIDFFNEDSLFSRFQRYNDKGTYFQTGLETFDAILGGGLKAKTITLFLGLTHAGKSANMINIAANQIKLGTNVAYFTLEMSEDEISQRVESHLLDIEINDIKYLEFDTFKSKILKLREQSYGKLMIKEFPTSYGSVTDIERILDDWKIKNNFTPDVIVIDYINIMKSVRIKEASNMYQMVKAISEEIRGLATKRNCAVLSATQTNRQASESSNVTMKDTSESFGVPMSADCYIALISTEALRNERIQVWKILKNRNTGIIDYCFGMKTKFEYSKVLDTANDVDTLETLQTNTFMLNNNPETALRVDKMKQRLNGNNEKKFNNEVILKKKNKPAEIVEMNFDKEDDFLDMIG